MNIFNSGCLNRFLRSHSNTSSSECKSPKISFYSLHTYAIAVNRPPYTKLTSIDAWELPFEVD